MNTMKEKIKNDMRECIVEALTDDMRLYTDADSKGSAPMAAVTTIQRLLRSMRYMENVYAHRIECGQCLGVGYYVSLGTYSSAHPIFVLGTIYLLLLSGADIHVRYEGSSPDPAVYWKPSVEEKVLEEMFDMFPQLKKVCVEDDDAEITAYLTAHPEIRHAVEFEECPNFHSALRLYETLGLSIHVPAAHILFVECTETSDDMRSALYKLGDMCSEESLDYCGYRGSKNHEDDYFGFDYADLFWSYKAELNFWKSLKTSRDKLMFVAFCDREERIEELRGYNDYMRLILNPDEDTFDEPLYDFMQLFRV